MKHIFYVGSNCGAAKAGLRVFDLDDETGGIRQLSQVEDAVDPIFLTRSADGKFLYVAQQVDPDGGAQVGGIAVYAVVGTTLEKRAAYRCARTVPCHVALSEDGRTLAYAEYRHATAGVFQVLPDGLLAGPSATVTHVGSGPNPTRQEAAHCHCATPVPGSSRLCVCDLGTDQVMVYETGPEGRELRRVDGAGFTCVPAAGPRHLVFHPRHPLAFLVNELDSSLVSLRHRGGGVFEEAGAYSLLPGDFSGTTKAAAVKVSPDGAWVLASNRGHDSIAAFRIDGASGRLRRLAISRLNGVFPRDFAFSPDGRFVVVGHKLSNEVAVYAFDAVTGALKQTAGTVSMPKPLCFVFA